MLCHQDESSFNRSRQSDEQRGDFADVLFEVLKIPNRRGKTFLGPVNPANYNFDYVGRKLPHFLIDFTHSPSFIC